MSAQPGRINTDQLLSQVDLVELVGRRVQLRRNGREHHGLCPFHDEKSPSFTVNPEKGFFHCFGCGAHGDAIGWVMQYDGLEFREACEVLGGGAVDRAAPSRAVQTRRVIQHAKQPLWVPLMPVPADAPPLFASASRTVPVWNPKRSKFWEMTFTRADEYRDAAGLLLGYVMRVEFGDAKVTPTVTWCVGPDSVEQWCVRPFPDPRPLQGLDALASMRDAPVLVVEGEKCRAAGASALRMYAVVAWPGGSKGMAHVDWSPLRDRDVVLWPDADDAGRTAMLGWEDRGGLLHRGVAQYAHAAGARSLRYVDPTGMPKGWDIYDALHGDDAWTPAQLAAWARSRVSAVDVQVDLRRAAR